MFNLGAGEVVVLILLGVIFLGPRKLSELVDGTLRARWRRSDWFVVGGVVVLGTVALALTVAR